LLNPSNLQVALKTKKPLHLKKDGTVTGVAVSPFDGANRIRFKGSQDIFDCRLSIGDLCPAARIS